MHGLAFLKIALMYIKKRRKKVKLINHDCLPIFMLLYIMFACLMLLAALCNAACLHNAFLRPLILAGAFDDFLMIFFFMLCLDLLTHSSFISSIILHHTLCF